MEETILITSSLLIGAGAGALLTYAHNLSLLQQYGKLVHDLTQIMRKRPDPPGPPAASARIVEWAPSEDAVATRAS